MLGNTIEEIAFNKGGIYKKDVPSMSVEQAVGGLEVLRERSKTAGASSFDVVEMIEGIEKIKLGESLL